MLARYMPELMPTYLRLVELAGGDDTAARMLTLWDPPRFSPDCSQLAQCAPDPMLCRNYDYSPHLFEGTVACRAARPRRCSCSTRPPLDHLPAGVSPAAVKG
jgi:hypothetical protein